MIDDNDDVDDLNRKQTGLTGGPNTLLHCLGQVEQREFLKEKRYDNVFFITYFIFFLYIHVYKHSEYRHTSIFSLKRIGCFHWDWRLNKPLVFELASSLFVFICKNNKGRIIRYLDTLSHLLHEKLPSVWGKTYE